MGARAADLIVNFTPTGMVPVKASAPAVPLTPAEVIEDVRMATALGISMVHLHARDAAGRPTPSADRYAEMIAGIRSFAPDLVICVSLSGRSWSELERRAEPLQLTGGLQPDMGSLTLASLNFTTQGSMNEPALIQSLAARMRDAGVKPELEVFDLGMANYANYLARKQLIEPPFYANVILGNIASAQADLSHAGLVLRELPPDCLWSLGGIGAAQLTMNAVAIATGGGVRVGLEDNIWFDSARARPASNRELLERVHALAALHGRGVMTPASLRERLGLAPGGGCYGVRRG